MKKYANTAADRCPELIPAAGGAIIAGTEISVFTGTGVLPYIKGK